MSLKILRLHHGPNSNAPQTFSEVVKSHEWKQIINMPEYVMWCWHSWITTMFYQSQVLPNIVHSNALFIYWGSTCILIYYFGIDTVCLAATLPRSRVAQPLIHFHPINFSLAGVGLPTNAHKCTAKLPHIAPIHPPKKNGILLLPYTWRFYCRVSAVEIVLTFDVRHFYRNSRPPSETPTCWNQIASEPSLHNYCSQPQCVYIYIQPKSSTFKSSKDHPNFILGKILCWWPKNTQTSSTASPCQPSLEIIVIAYQYKVGAS